MPKSPILATLSDPGQVRRQFLAAMSLKNTKSFTWYICAMTQNREACCYFVKFVAAENVQNCGLQWRNEGLWKTFKCMIDRCKWLYTFFKLRKANCSKTNSNCSQNEIIAVDVFFVKRFSLKQHMQRYRMSNESFLCRFHHSVALLTHFLFAVAEKPLWVCTFMSSKLRKLGANPNLCMKWFSSR